jgi:hypothetical protein
MDSASEKDILRSRMDSMAGDHAFGRVAVEFISSVASFGRLSMGNDRKAVDNALSTVVAVFGLTSVYRSNLVLVFTGLSVLEDARVSSSWKYIPLRIHVSSTSAVAIVITTGTQISFTKRPKRPDILRINFSNKYLKLLHSIDYNYCLSFVFSINHHDRNIFNFRGVITILAAF